MIEWQTKKLLELGIARYERTVYVKPEWVVQISFNDLQESPRYFGGLALRFAVGRRHRENKIPSEADTIQKVRQILEARR
jgi:DNA ligase-1